MLLVILEELFTFRLTAVATNGAEIDQAGTELDKATTGIHQRFYQYGNKQYNQNNIPCPMIATPSEGIRPFLRYVQIGDIMQTEVQEFLQFFFTEIVLDALHPCQRELPRLAQRFGRGP